MLVKTSSLDVSVHRRRLLKVSKGVTAFAVPTLNPTKDPNSAIYVVDQVCVCTCVCVHACVRVQVCVCVHVCMCVLYVYVCVSVVCVCECGVCDGV